MMRFLLALILLAPACSDPSSGFGSISGTYAYQAFDDQSRPLVQGILQITQTGAQLSGTWSNATTPLGAQTDVGPQVGTGTLSGTITGTGFTISLNPAAQNYVELRGGLNNDRLVGSWEFVSTVPPGNGGPMIAILIP